MFVSFKVANVFISVFVWHLTKHIFSDAIRKTPKPTKSKGNHTWNLPFFELRRTDMSNGEKSDHHHGHSLFSLSLSLTKLKAAHNVVLVGIKCGRTDKERLRESMIVFKRGHGWRLSAKVSYKYKYHSTNRTTLLYTQLHINMDNHGPYGHHKW